MCFARGLPKLDLAHTRTVTWVFRQLILHWMFLPYSAQGLMKHATRKTSRTKGLLLRVINLCPAFWWYNEGRMSRSGEERKQYLRERKDLQANNEVSKGTWQLGAISGCSSDFCWETWKHLSFSPCFCDWNCRRGRKPKCIHLYYKDKPRETMRHWHTIITVLE